MGYSKGMLDRYGAAIEDSDKRELFLGIVETIQFVQEGTRQICSASVLRAAFAESTVNDFAADFEKRFTQFMGPDDFEKPEKPDLLEIPKNWKNCVIKTAREDVLSANWFQMHGCVVTHKEGVSFTIVKGDPSHDMEINAGLQTIWENFKDDIEVKFE